MELIEMILNAKIFKKPIQILFTIVSKFVEKLGGEIVFYREDPERVKIIKMINKIKDEHALLLRNMESYLIYMVAKATQKIEGDIAEVGTFKGGSAKIISEVKKNKSLYLFDTFEGLPDVDQNDALSTRKVKWAKSQFKASYDDVKNYLNSYSNIYIHKGTFPETAEPIKNKMFSFVHLDVDTYKSTLDCLEYFYPRMNKGGIIISHDYYVTAAGVVKAVDEFFEDKPETVIGMYSKQCMIVKL